MTNFKGMDRLTKKVEKFFAELGFSEIECFMSNEFAYYSDSEEVSYSIFEDSLSDEGYIKYLHSTYDEIPPCSMFTFSLLHELGHHITLPTIKKSKRLKVRKAKKALNRKIRRTAKTAEDIVNFQIVYCKLLDERIATRKAVEILKSNYKIVKKYDKIFNKEVNLFYKNNNLSELFSA